MPFYDNQKNASDELIEGIRNGERYQMLIAQMQSGKTGTYFLTAFRAIALDLVSSVIIFTGNREKELKEQCMSDLKKEKNKFTNYLYVSMNEIDAGRKEQVLQKIDDRVQIYWGQDLAKSPPIKPNTLLIWEESHYAQSFKNQPDYFRQRNQFEVNGQNTLNEKSDIYIISVSATPFSEISDELHYVQGKRIVKLEVGDNYRGVQHFYENGKIIPIPVKNGSTKKSVEDWTTTIDRAMMKQFNQPEPKYHIVRGVEKGKDPTRERIFALARNFGFDIKEHTQQKSDLVWVKETDNGNTTTIKGLSCLEKKPDKHTIVFIKNMCRMGKVVPKKHIGFVFETASSSTKTDTILQGLLGRMCGHDHDGNDSIEIYVPQTMFKSENGFNQIERYIRFFNDFDMLPTKAMNIVGLNVHSTKRRFTEKRYSTIQNLCDTIPYDNVPVIIPREKRTKFVKDGNSDHTEIIEDIKRNIDLFNENNYNEHVEDLIRTVENDNMISRRKFKAGSSYVKQRRHIQMYNAIQTKTGFKNWTDVDKIQVCEIQGDDDSVLSPFRSGDLIVCWACIPYTEEAIQKLTVLQQTPKTTGNEIFNHKSTNDSEDGIVELDVPHECSVDKDTFRRRLLGFFTENQSHKCKEMRIVTNNNGIKCKVSFDRSLYGEQTQMHDFIKMCLIDIRIRIIQIDTRVVDDNTIIVSSIRWENKYV